MTEETPKLSKRNFSLGIFNGSILMLGGTLVNTETVMAAFVVELMGGNVIWVGLLISVFASSIYWPQVLLANRLESRPRRLPYYWFAAIMRTLTRGLLATVLLLGTGLSPVTLFILVTLLLLLWASALGVAIIPFWSVVTDSIPPNWRGKFLGGRQLIGGLLSIAAGFFVVSMLSPDSGYSFPRNYGLLALYATFFTFLGTGAWCLAEERPHPVQKRRVSVGFQFRRGPRLLRKDVNYRRLLRAAVFYGLSMSFVTPFIVPYALKHLGIAVAAVGAFIIARQLGFSLASSLWSYISDHFGNRLLLLITSSMALLIPLLMLGMSMVQPDSALTVIGLSVDLQVAYLVAVFAIVGTTTSGRDLGHSNYLLEVAPARKRATYLGFMSAVMLPLAWSPFLASLLIGRADRFMLAFGLSLAAALICLYNVVRLSEVRFEENGGNHVGRPSASKS